MSLALLSLIDEVDESNVRVEIEVSPETSVSTQSTTPTTECLLAMPSTFTDQATTWAGILLRKLVISFP